MVSRRTDRLLHKITHHTNLTQPYSDYVRSNKFPAQNTNILGRVVTLRYKNKYKPDLDPEDIIEDIEPDDDRDLDNIFENRFYVVRCDNVTPHKFIAISVDYEIVIVGDSRNYRDVVHKFPKQIEEYIGLFLANRYEEGSQEQIAYIKGVLISCDSTEPCNAVIAEFYEGNTVRFVTEEEAESVIFDRYDADGDRDYDGIDPQNHGFIFINVDGKYATSEGESIYLDVNGGYPDPLEDMYRKDILSPEEVCELRRRILYERTIFGLEAIFPKEITLNRTSLILYKNETFQLEATVIPESAQNTITWSSSDESIATVDETGLVTSISSGRVRIYATSLDVWARCNLNSIVEVEGITIDTSISELIVGESETINITIDPEDASDKHVTWRSSNNSIIRVDNNGVITAVSPGTATITATTRDGGFSASITLESISNYVPVESINVTNDPGVIILSTNEPDVPRTFTATIEVLPERASNKAITVSMKDPTKDYAASVRKISDTRVEITGVCYDCYWLNTIVITSQDNPSITKELYVAVNTRLEDISLVPTDMFIQPWFWPDESEKEGTYILNFLPQTILFNDVKIGVNGNDARNARNSLRTSTGFNWYSDLDWEDYTLTTKNRFAYETNHIWQSDHYSPSTGFITYSNPYTGETKTINVTIGEQNISRIRITDIPQEEILPGTSFDIHLDVDPYYWSDYPAKYPISWSVSGNEEGSIVLYDKGADGATIEVIKEGTITVTASSGNVSDSFTFEIQPFIPVEFIRIYNIEKDIDTGDYKYAPCYLEADPELEDHTIELDLEITPANATNKSIIIEGFSGIYDEQDPCSTLVQISDNKLLVTGVSGIAEDYFIISSVSNPEVYVELYNYINSQVTDFEFEDPPLNAKIIYSERTRKCYCSDESYKVNLSPIYWSINHAFQVGPAFNSLHDVEIDTAFTGLYFSFGSSEEFYGRYENFYLDGNDIGNITIPKATIYLTYYTKDWESEIITKSIDINFTVQPPADPVYITENGIQQIRDLPHWLGRFLRIEVEDGEYVVYSTTEETEAERRHVIGKDFDESYLPWSMTEFFEWGYYKIDTSNPNFPIYINCDCGLYFCYAQIGFKDSNNFKEILDAITAERSFYNLELSFRHWDAHNLTSLYELGNYYYTYGGYVDYEGIDFTFINANNITDIRKAFNGGFVNLNMHYNPNHGILGLETWDVSNVTSLNLLATEAYVTFWWDVDLRSWDVSNVRDMSFAFLSYCWDPSYGHPFNITGWDVSNVTNMKGMFEITHIQDELTGYCRHDYVIADFENWDVSNVTDMSYMFAGSLLNENELMPGYTGLANWNVSNVTNMSYMFYASNVKFSTIANWDVSNVRDMSYMFASNDFYDGTIDNNINALANWDVSNVTNMSWMFCIDLEKAFNITGLANWDVSNVTNFESIFKMINYSDGITVDLTGINNWKTKFGNKIDNISFINMVYMDSDYYVDEADIIYPDWPGTFVYGSFIPDISPVTLSAIVTQTGTLYPTSTESDIKTACTFDLSGVDYWGVTREILLENCTISPAGPYNIGQQTLTLSCGTASTTFTVTISSNAPIQLPMYPNYGDPEFTYVYISEYNTEEHNRLPINYNDVLARYNSDFETLLSELPGFCNYFFDPVHYGTPIESFTADKYDIPIITSIKYQNYDLNFANYEFLIFKQGDYSERKSIGCVYVPKNQNIRFINGSIFSDKPFTAYDITDYGLNEGNVLTHWQFSPHIAEYTATLQGNYYVATRNTWKYVMFSSIGIYWTTDINATGTDITSILADTIGYATVPKTGSVGNNQFINCNNVFPTEFTSYNWDFTRSLVDTINDVNAEFYPRQSTTSISTPATGQYEQGVGLHMNYDTYKLKIPVNLSSKTTSYVIEIDFTDFELYMTSWTLGFIQTIGDHLYDNAINSGLTSDDYVFQITSYDQDGNYGYYLTSITDQDADYFANSTMKIINRITENNNVIWDFYKDNVLIFSTPEYNDYDNPFIWDNSTLNLPFAIGGAEDEFSGIITGMRINVVEPESPLYNWDFTRSLIDTNGNNALFHITPDTPATTSIPANGQFVQNVGLIMNRKYPLDIPVNMISPTNSYTVEIDFVDCELIGVTSWLVGFIESIPDTCYQRFCSGIGESDTKFGINVDGTEGALNYYEIDLPSTTYFTNSTMKIVNRTAQNGNVVWDIYKDNTLFLTTPDHGSVSNEPFFWDISEGISKFAISGYSGELSATITGMRIYENI